MTRPLRFLDAEMIDLSVMTSTDFTPAPTMANHSVSTRGFGNSNRAMHPNSVLEDTSMPAAWQTRGVAYDMDRYQYGAPVRSIIDIVADPFRWLVATTPRKLMSLGVSIALVLTFIF